MHASSVTFDRSALVLCAALSACAGEVAPASRAVPALSGALGVAEVSNVPAAMSTSSAFAFAKFGGYEGERFVPHASGDVFEYSEDVAVTFTQPLDTSSFRYTISPLAPSSVYFGNDYLRTADITVRKTPGVTYLLTIPAGIRDRAGDSLVHAVARTFTTEAVPKILAPVRPTPDEPYRYGVLGHPFPTSLAASNASERIATLAAAGVRFVRIDYCGAQSEPARGVFDFATEDGIMDRLASHGITELPLIDQYCSPGWANGGSSASSAIWSTPAEFARFAARVAAHVSATYPQIARMELFNEPNLAGWWNAPAPYADPTGAGTAAYMRAAYAAVKAAAPAMIVVGPALADGGGGVTDPRIFLQNMYAAGCRTGVCWDVLSVHNYAWMNPNFASVPDLPSTYFNRWDVYRDLQSIALAAGEPVAPHVMLTEWGISTDATSPQGFDPAVQAKYLSFAFVKMGDDPTVDGLVYANIDDPGTGFFSDMALTSANFEPAPAFAVYRDFAEYRHRKGGAP